MANMWRDTHDGSLRRLAFSEASEEMEKPRMTRSAREQTQTANDLVVKNHADKRTVDVHPATVVVDEA
jgi:hypothetical protein